MNAKQVIAALQSLVDHTITTQAQDGGYVEMHVAEVCHLPSDERVSDGGNVILATGRVDECGWMEGLVFWARDVLRIDWDGNSVAFVGREKTCWVKVWR